MATESQSCGFCIHWQVWAWDSERARLRVGASQSACLLHNKPTEANDSCPDWETRIGAVPWVLECRYTRRGQVRLA